MTNHKSQGSTYDKVIVNADVSQQKTSYNAFYVQATRARYDITIVTDNKDKLAKQAAVRENKISTLDEIFVDFARRQQARTAEIRAEEAEFTQKAEKANIERFETRIDKEINDVIKTPEPKLYDTTRRVENIVTMCKNIPMQDSMTADLIKNKYAEQHRWEKYNPPEQMPNGNYIVAKNEKQHYIIAQRHDDGDITYWACIGMPDNTAKPEKGKKSKPCNNLQDAKAIIDNFWSDKFLRIIEKNVEMKREKAKAIKEKEIKPKSTGKTMELEL